MEPALHAVPGRGECLDEQGADGVCVRRVEFERGPVVEWWANRTDGVQQAWELAERPAGDGPLVIAVDVEGASPDLEGDRVLLLGDGGGLWSYGSPGMAIAPTDQGMNSDSRSFTNSALLDETPVFATGQAASVSHSVARATHRVLTVPTSTRLELINLTQQVQDVVKSAQVTEGLVLVSSLHTTFALMVNEWQEALLEDIKTMLGTVWLAP